MADPLGVSYPIVCGRNETRAFSQVIIQPSDGAPVH
ncbi:MAG: hypothetical protein JWP25_1503 [Bradyrhizobium sp.]|nr:hypothetical protein [Bradyrhizobium sp.]